MHLVDGSGLSRLDFVTAHSVATVLQSAAERAAALSRRTCHSPSWCRTTLWNPDTASSSSPWARWERLAARSYTGRLGQPMEIKVADTSKGVGVMIDSVKKTVKRAMK